MRTAAVCWTAAILVLVILADPSMCRAWEVRVPQNHTALSGDLTVTVTGTPPHGARLELLRATQAGSTRFAPIGSVPLPPPAPSGSNTTTPDVEVRFPCGLLTQGGSYGVRLNDQNSGKRLKTSNLQSEQNTSTEKGNISTLPKSQNSSSPIQELDVRWPAVVLNLAPARIQTYPELPVTATLEFPGIKCRPAAGAVVPELWMELLFCGHSPIGCTDTNATHKQVLYAEQLRGYRRLSLKLRCELFGLAGHYALTVRSALPTSRPVIHDAAAAAYLKVAWSEKFVFNVHARSIFPCDPHSGVAVLFQYPACILETGDRVRLFARLRADVASLVPPTSLHYKAEQRVTRGQHSLYFDCDLFSERYVEYCFVYVSQAITGAVSDVRVDCVPTLPVRESDSGGWGSWSAWTTCSTSCGGGTRNRYRLCDSPPPRYGAKFCEVMKAFGGVKGAVSGDAALWLALVPGTVHGAVPEDDQEVADRPEVQAEVGPGCRCGCVVHLGYAKPRRLVATSSKSCPGRTFWLIQANEGHIMHLSMHYLRLPCASQWLKVRDGNSLSATLIALLTGNQVPGHPIASSGQYLLLEFFSDELTAGGVDCGGGFLAEAQQIPSHPNKTALLSGREGIVFTAVSSSPVSPPNLTMVHIASLMFVCVVLAVSACLAAQYLHRYRKYQLAAAHEDTETITGSHCSRAASNATLLSEVISLKRFGRHRTHDRLQEEDEDGYESTEHEYEVIESGPKDDSSPVPTDKQSTLSLPCTPPGSPASLPRSTTLGSSQGSRLPNGSKEMEAASEREWRIPRRPLSRGARTVSRGPSLATLTNGRCSPASSILSRNPKEHKDKRNMERLLAGSEFSLPGPEHDLELDYYDYNVTNAGTVPGSYLGMDPAYLLWIPPFAPGCWEEESDQALALADLHSQQDLVERDQNGIELDMEQVTEFIPRAALYLNPEQGSVTELDNKEVESSEEVHKSKKERNKFPEAKQNGVELQDTFMSKKSDSLRTVEQFPLHEFPTMRDQAHYKGDKVQESPVRVHRRPAEKETRVEKSPSDEGEYCDILDGDNDDIKFADDEDDEEEMNSCDRIIVTESNKNRHIRV